MMLPVSEIFYSLQGEGLRAGRPSIFLRLGGCNLRCQGFGVVREVDGKRYVGCDTMQAVYVEPFGKLWRGYDNSLELIQDMEATLPHGKSYDIVLTGGEPTLHYSDSVLIEVLEYFQQKGRSITIETNATVVIDFEAFPVYKACTFAMAVKLSNSGEPESKRINDKAISRIFTQAGERFFKFVLDAEHLKELSQEITALTSRYDAPVYCMALGHDAQTLAKHDKAVFSFCAANGYRYSERAHIRVWGDRPKV